MELTLSWDLIVIIFFALVVAYSFIVGKDQSVKIIIATYVAIVAVQGIGNLLERLSAGSLSLWTTLGLPSNVQLISTAKIAIFVTAIIVLTLRGGLHMQYERDTEGLLDPLLTGAFGFATAGLLLSTLLTYISGRPLLDTQLISAPTLAPLLQGSTLVPIMVEQQDLWFSLPAFLLLCMGFFRNRE